MGASPSEETGLNPLTTPPKQGPDWGGLVSRGLSLIAIGWLFMMLLSLAVLYQYAWQKGLYPKPGAPSSPAHGPWCYDVFLEEGVRGLINPPLYSGVFASFSLLAKPSWRSGILLALSIICFIIALDHIGLVED